MYLHSYFRAQKETCLIQKSGRELLFRITANPCRERSWASALFLGVHCRRRTFQEFIYRRNKPHIQGFSSDSWNWTPPGPRGAGMDQNHRTPDPHHVQILLLEDSSNRVPAIADHALNFNPLVHDNLLRYTSRTHLTGKSPDSQYLRFITTHL